MKGGLILAIVGAILLLLSMCATGISLLMPIINGPRVDFDEILPYFLGGGCCSSISLLMTIGGVVWMLLDRKPAGPKT